MRAHWRVAHGLHVASAQLPDEGELPSLDGATGLAQISAADAGRAPRECGPGRRLDLYLHQLAAPASLPPRLVRQICWPVGS